MYQCMKIAEFKALLFPRYKNHQDILNVTKVMTGYIQEPRLKILVGAQGFEGPTPSWLHNDLFIPPDVPS